MSLERQHAVAVAMPGLFGLVLNRCTHFSPTRTARAATLRNQLNLEDEMRLKSLAAVPLMLVAGWAAAQPVAPWTDPTQANSHYWTYDFSDDAAPHVIETEGGTWDPGSDPKFELTSDPAGAPPSQNGRLGIFNAAADSVADVKLLIPNQRDVRLDKWFWFSYDRYTTGGFVAAPTFGSKDPLGTVLVGADYPEALNSTDVVNGVTHDHLTGVVHFSPQPASEWLNIHMGAEKGHSIWIDNLKVGSVCDVPEPQTYALLIVGLGVMGLAVRRKTS
jgi:hypothetical protein